MIARTWRGATRADDADAYVDYLRETGFREYRETPGNAGVTGLRRLSGDRAEFLLVTLWETRDAIRRFAGADPSKAVFYPEDDRFLVDRDEHVDHFDVVHSANSRDQRGSLTSIAPDIFRKRLLIEGFFTRDVTHDVLVEYFDHLTRELGLRTYGPPVIHRTSGQGKEANEGFDAFVPLVDSGIYIAVWLNQRFLSTILYTCAPFDEKRAVALVHEFFGLTRHEASVF